MSSNVLQPNPPHNTKIISPLSAQTALLQPPKKNHIFINVSKDHFSRFMWAFLGLSWSDFHRENRKQELSLSLPPLLFLLLYLSLSLSLSLSLYLPYPSFIIVSSPAFFSLSSSLISSPSVQRFINLGLWVVVLLCDLMSKKMKRMVMESSPHAVYEDAKSRFKHQSLLQDFHELQKVISLCGFGRSGYSFEFPLWGSLDFPDISCLLPTLVWLLRKPRKRKRKFWILCSTRFCFLKLKNLV